MNVKTKHLMRKIYRRLESRRKEKSINRACKLYGEKAEALFEEVKQGQKYEQALEFFGHWMPWLLIKRVVEHDELRALPTADLKAAGIVVDGNSSLPVKKGKWTVIDSQFVALGSAEVHAFGESLVTAKDKNYVTVHDSSFALMASGFVDAFDQSRVKLEGQVICNLYDDTFAMVAGSSIVNVYERAVAQLMPNSKANVVDRREAGRTPGGTFL